MAAYCFEANETMEEAIRRIAHEQLTDSASRLATVESEADDAVHAVRRSMKRMRGLIRLVRTCLGDDLFRLENDTYRQAAAQLSGLRDATVLISTLETVYEDVPSDLAPAAGAVHAWLIQNRGDTYAAADREKQVFTQICQDLHIADVRVDEWPIDECSWTDLSEGMRQIYSQGREEYDQCCWRPTVEALHNWRKRVKYLWHQVLLLTPIWPRPMKVIADELDELGGLLGLDHDCAELAHVVSKQIPEQMLPADARDELMRVIYTRRRRLQERGRHLGCQLYAEKPGAFVKRVGSYWLGWQRHLPAQIPGETPRVHSVPLEHAPVLQSPSISAELKVVTSIEPEEWQPEMLQSGQTESQMELGKDEAGQGASEQPECIVDLPCQTGEGPLWHPEEEVLYWVDIPQGRLYRFTPDSGANDLVFERKNGAIGGLTIQADGSLLLFMDRGAIGIWRDGHGLEILIDEIEPERDSRFNDVIADPRGRVFCGTMPTGRAGGRLYRLDPDASLTELFDEVGCSNGMGFTPTEDGFYFIDSPSQQISRFDYDRSSGDLSGRTLFVDTTGDAGVPDGMTVDAEGCIWCARWDGAVLVRYSPAGDELQRIHFPVQKVSSATFGGPDLEDLYVTTAGGQDRESNGELAGSLFHLRPGVRGRAEFRSLIGVGS